MFVHWYKQNSRLPLGYEVNGGDLYLHNLQIHDSGVYICQAVNNETTHVFEDTVSITISSKSSTSDPYLDPSLKNIRIVRKYKPFQMLPFIKKKGYAKAMLARYGTEEILWIKDIRSPVNNIVHSSPTQPTTSAPRPRSSACPRR